jgi:hypothetical protein
VGGFEPPSRRPPATEPARRLSPLPDRFDVGEQVIGSTHVFELPLPFDLGITDAALAVQTTGDKTLQARLPRAQLAPARSLRGAALEEQQNHPIEICFTPDRAGIVAAQLALTARWLDGHREVQGIALTGRARELTSAPAPIPQDRARERASAQQAAELHNTEVARYEAKDWRHHVVTLGDKAGFDAEQARADRAARHLAHVRKDGIETVAKEVESYVAPTPGLSPWRVLAELALDLATGGIAELVAKKVAVSLGRMVFAAEEDSRLVMAMGSALKNKLKQASHAAIAKITESDLDVHASANARIAFFERQSLALANLEDEQSAVVAERAQYLLPLIATRPESATAALRVLADTFEAAQPTAEVDQKAATSAQWLAVLARVVNGPDELGGGAVVTQLADARAPGSCAPPRPLMGVLDLHLDLDHGPPRVTTATTRGVAAAVALNVVTMDLARTPIPLRIVIAADTPNPTLITRDELGRVRVAGDLVRLAAFVPHEAAPTNELQAERAARAVCELALGRTLEQWHARVRTDDRSDGGL